MSQVRFYTIEEVAKILRVSEAKVRQLIQSGELRATTVGRQYRISEEALQEYIDKQTRSKD